MLTLGEDSSADVSPEAACTSALISRRELKMHGGMGDTCVRAGQMHFRFSGATRAQTTAIAMSPSAPSSDKRHGIPPVSVDFDPQLIASASAKLASDLECLPLNEDIKPCFSNLTPGLLNHELINDNKSRPRVVSPWHNQAAPSCQRTRRAAAEADEEAGDLFGPDCEPSRAENGAADAQNVTDGQWHPSGSSDGTCSVESSLGAYGNFSLNATRNSASLERTSSPWSYDLVWSLSCTISSDLLMLTPTATATVAPSKQVTLQRNPSLLQYAEAVSALR